MDITEQTRGKYAEVEYAWGLTYSQVGQLTSNINRESMVRGVRGVESLEHAKSHSALLLDIQ